MSTDAELLQAYARENSQTAFTELVERHLRLVYLTALRQLGGDSHLAEDVTQKVFSDLARKASSLTGRNALAGWLYLGAHHAAAQAVRANRRRRMREQEAHVMHDDVSATPAGEWDRVRPVLDAALRDLSETDREAVLLRFFEQRPFSKIGAALNLREDAARMRVDRALEKLRVVLERRGVTSTTAMLTATFSQQAAFAVPPGLANSIASAALAQAGTLNAANAASAFLMSTPIVVSTVIALVAIGGVVYQTRQTRVAEARAATLVRERDDVLSALREARRDGTQIAQQRTQVESQMAALRSSASSLPPVTTAPTTRVAVGAESKVGMLTLTTADGTVRDSMIVPTDMEGRRAMLRDAIDARYPALYRKLGWTETQREQFKQLMVGRKEAGDRLFEAAFAQGIQPDREFSRGVSAHVTAEMNAKLRAVFGEAAFEAIQYFENTIPMRNIADELAKALFYSDTPLAPPQAEQLIDLIAASARTANGKYDLAVVSSEAIITSAQGVLSPPQLAKLRDLEAQRVEQRKLRESFNATQGATKQSNLPKPPGS